MSMITNVYYVPTLLGALSNTYPAGSYVRTLGFATIGDGGAAMYEVVSVSGSQISYPNVSLYCEDGRFSKTAFTCFKLIPQNGKVYAEQFGVLPGDTVDCNTNTTMMNRAVDYASRKGFVLEFASNKTYYFSSSIVIKSNLFIEGNGATLRVHDEASNSCNLFNMTSNTDLQSNVTVRNLTVVGRTVDGLNKGDQAFHICIDGFTLQNVTIKNFSFGIHTYGRKATIDDYTVPEIPNKNWLIDGCTVTDTIMGLQLSEIDGITVKDSTITSIYPTGFPVNTKGNHSYYDGSEYPEAHIYDELGGLHNIYMSSNCLNVRINNVILGNVTGDAVHKSYAVADDDKASDRFIRFDKSKNHFYTDLSINKCNAPLNIGFISENVMCDNVFGTDLRYLVHLSAASNCIVANSSLTVERKTFERPNAQNPKQIDTVNPNLGLYVHSACSCWFQNSYLKTNGRQRSCPYETEDAYYREMSIKPNDSTDDNFADKRHMRTFIGAGFDIPNHWFKFTGCDMESTYGGIDYYFYEDINKVVNSNVAVPNTYQFGEFWDNSSLTTYIKDACLWHMYCINDLPGGLTIRNSYINAKNGTPKAPFRFCCWTKNCTDENNVCAMNKYCIHAKFGKYFPWLHLENSMFKGMTSGYNNSDWYYIITYGDALKNFGQEEATKKAVKLSNSYGINCYKLDNKTYEQLSLN